MPGKGSPSSPSQAGTHSRPVCQDCALLIGGTVPERASSDVRDAVLAHGTHAEGGALRCAREALRGAEATLEAVRVDERVEREALRLLTGRAVL